MTEPKPTPEQALARLHLAIQDTMDERTSYAKWLATEASGAMPGAADLRRAAEAITTDLLAALLATRDAVEHKMAVGALFVPVTDAYALADSRARILTGLAGAVQMHDGGFHAHCEALDAMRPLALAAATARHDAHGLVL